MNLSDRLVIAPEIMSRQIGEEMVLLDLASGTYFGLDRVGARLWELLSENKSIAEACDVITAEYDVNDEVARFDAMALCENLIEKQLVRIAS
jgi:Coenzyme PQQ synthesis protein D (PqqD)